ncbi:MAG: hypothetical protein FJ087_18390 [Deltaproteobacteria bacterium]|nr:hypothetical protein [Deltaproteobacteria bacterium]
MRPVAWILGAAVLVAAAGAFAQEGEKTASPEDVQTGEVRISLSSDYARLRVNGEEWEEHAFSDNGKTLVVHSVKRTEEQKITLTALPSDLAPVELTIKPEDWKLVAVAKNEKVWRVERKVVFQKKTAGEAKPSPAPAPATPKQ